MNSELHTLRVAPLLAGVLIALSAISAVAATPAPPPIVEFAVPTTNSAPGSITAGPDGNLWFTEEAGNKIGRISPSGAFGEFSLAAGASPGGIVTGPDGNLWFTEQGANKIGRMTLDGSLVEFAIPTPASGPVRIARGADGNLWFTERVANKIGRIAPDGTVAEFARTNPGSQPTGIAAGPDGNVWFTVYSPGRTCTTPPSNCAPSEPTWIGRITPTGTITEFPLTKGTRPFGIAAGPDGNLWFTEAAFIGRITPSGTVTEFVIPLRSVFCCVGMPGEIAAGPDGNLWFTDLGANTVGRVSVTGSIAVFPTPSQNVGQCSPPCSQGLALGADGHLWFTEPHDNNVAVLDVGAAPLTNLVWRHTETGDVDVWSLSGTRVESATRLASGVPVEWQVVGTGDLDFNGVPDLVWRNSRNGDVAAWLIRGTAVSQSAIVSPAVTPDWQIAGVGDLNGDGTADLFWRNQLSGDVTVWLMLGGRLYSAIYGIAVVSSGLPLTWDLAGVGDVDGDGIADLIWRNRDSGDVAVWFMWGFINPDGSGHHIAPVRLALIVASAVPSAWQIAGVRDVDGDGRADLVWRHMQTGDVAVWLMNGATVVRSAVVSSSVPLAWQIAKVADIDGDGKADLVWRHTQNGDVAVWVMDGVVVTQAPVIATGVPLEWQIQ